MARHWHNWYSAHIVWLGAHIARQRLCANPLHAKQNRCIGQPKAIAFQRLENYTDMSGYIIDGAVIPQSTSRGAEAPDTPSWGAVLGCHRLLSTCHTMHCLAHRCSHMITRLIASALPCIGKCISDAYNTCNYGFWFRFHTIAMLCFPHVHALQMRACFRGALFSEELLWTNSCLAIKAHAPCLLQRGSSTEAWCLSLNRTLYAEQNRKN